MLNGAYSNPFNPTTTIEYSLPQDANVKLIIYDIMGELVKTLTSDIQYAGKNKIMWDGMNSNGARVASGIYIYRFEATTLKNNQHFEKSAKLVFVK